MYSKDIEYQLLASVLQDPEQIAYHGITTDYFAIESHRHIFDSIERIYRAGQKPDCWLVLEDLDTMNLRDVCGGLEYIGPLQSDEYRNSAAYARICAEKKVQRSIAEASAKLLEIAENPDMEPDDRIENALNAVIGVKHDRHADRPATAKESVLAAIEFAQRTANLSDGEILGLPTGITALDSVLNGLQDGDLIVVAGRPSMGKSSLGMQIAEHNARMHKNTLVFTLEMGKAQLMLRTLSGVSKVPLKAVMRGMSGEQCAEFTQAGAVVAGWPIFIDERPALTIGKISSTAKRKKLRKGLDLIVIDQLTHVKLPGTGRKHEELGEVTKRCKQLAKELQVPVVLLHQLRRPPEGKAHRPDMTMLKDSGSIEEDADVIIMAHRPHYYDEEGENPTYAELIVEKNRMGERGVVQCGWAGEFTRFTNTWDRTQDVQKPTKRGGGDF